MFTNFKHISHEFSIYAMKCYARSIMIQIAATTRTEAFSPTDRARVPVRPSDTARFQRRRKRSPLDNSFTARRRPAATHAGNCAVLTGVNIFSSSRRRHVRILSTLVTMRLDNVNTDIRGNAIISITLISRCWCADCSISRQVSVYLSVTHSYCIEATCSHHQTVLTTSLSHHSNFINSKRLHKIPSAGADWGDFRSKRKRSFGVKLLECSVLMVYFIARHSVAPLYINQFFVWMPSLVYCGCLFWHVCTSWYTSFMCT